GSGGVLGQLLSGFLLPRVSFVGTTVLMLATLLLGLTLMIEISWLSVLDRTGRATLTAVASIKALFQKLRLARQNRAIAVESNKARQFKLEQHAENERQ
ncbi:DNA translocase FtsK 4TM domain-containing protein, partial [Pseudomonadales bacterium]|nr:DNA translocase FtsK 4TM domain-containing protein [Pseudomonadales bacterium]